MSSEPRFAELGECLSLIIDHRGKTPKKLGSDWVEQGVPTISAKNVSGGRLVAEEAIRYVSHDVYKRWMNNVDVQRGDCLLVSEGATLGECMYWDEDHPVVLGQRLFCLRANPEVLYARYLYFYMTTHSFQSEVMARATGTSVPGLRQTEVLKLQIRLPSLDEQRVIGDTLYNLNKKSELNRQMNETLEIMARALFKSWFVDFDPVRAKAERRDPGLPKPLADLFPDSFEDSESGEIPKGWSVGKLGDVLCQRVERCAPSAETVARPYVPIDCISPKSLFLTESKPGEEAQSSLTKFYKGDLLFGAMRPYFHKVCIAPFDGTTRTTAFVLYPSQSDDFGFATLLLHHPDTIDFATRHSTGSTIPYAVWTGSLEDMPVVLPPPDVRKAFNSVVQLILFRIPEPYFENRTLAALRDSLLPKLIAGEVRVNVMTKRYSHG